MGSFTETAGSLRNPAYPVIYREITILYVKVDIRMTFNPMADKELFQVGRYFSFDPTALHWCKVVVFCIADLV